MEDPYSVVLPKVDWTCGWGLAVGGGWWRQQVGRGGGLGLGDEPWSMLKELCSLVLPNVDWTCGWWLAVGGGW